MRVRRETGGSGLSRLLVHSAWAIAAAAIIVYSATALIISRANLESQAAAVREERLASARALIKGETERALQYIERSRSDTRHRLEVLLRQRVEEAVSIAQNLYLKHHAVHTDEEIGAVIVEALRAVRFNEGRGYFFATRLDGVEMLFADRPALEGRNLLGLRDSAGRPVVADMIALVRAKGEGYYSYAWTKPGAGTADFPKLAYVKLFAPLGWLIGTGEYLDDFERTTKDEVISRLANVSFGTDGYLFAGQWDGVSLMGPARGKNMIGTTDAEGVRVVEKLIEAARAGGGFVQYVMPPLEGKRSLPKLSYVLPLPAWQWYVGAGQYLADIEGEIKARRDTLLAIAMRQGGWLAVTVLVLLAGMVSAAAWVSRRLAGEFRVFDAFFRQVPAAAGHPPRLEPGSLQFLELRSLAATVNSMLADRAAAEADRARLATAVEQSAEIVMIVDRALTVEYVNPACERITGRPHARVVGRPAPCLHEAFVAGDRPQILAAVAAEQAWSGRITVRRANGTPVELEIGFSPVRGAGGAVTHFAVAARDITERLRLEGQLAQSRKMEALGQLAGGVAHDFNNLLQVIQGYAELGQQNLPASHPSRGHLAEVIVAATRAADLVRQLLTFGRRDSFHPRPLDVNTLLRDFMRILTRLIGEHIEVVVTYGEGLPMIQADLVLVQQVVMNLCTNARDAMPAGGRMLLSTSAVQLEAGTCALHPPALPGPYVRLEVSDSGGGIAPEHRDRIFEPFFTTKEVGRGTGLGLATVYGIVQQHGGFIEVDGEVGRGTTFSVFLPAAGAPEEPRGAAALPGIAGGIPRTVLLAEDEPQVRELATRVLELAGHRVIQAADGREALRLFHEHVMHLDLAVLDIVMPHLGGRAVRDRIRQVRADLPILLVTGYGRDQLPRDFEPGQREIMLQKPWTAQKLLDAIVALLAEASGVPA